MHRYRTAFVLSATAAFLAGSLALEASSGAEVPAKTILYLRLTTPVSTKTSHLHDAISAQVVREVIVPGGVAIPMGSVVTGRIDKLIPSSTPNNRALLRMTFNHLAIPGQPGTLDLRGHVTAVENAREQVLADGKIQGVLESELPISSLGSVLGKLGQSNPTLGAEVQRTLGKPDTSINFPPGTDLQFVLDKPLVVAQLLPPAVPALSPALTSTLQGLLAHAPQRSTSKDGKPGDPLNLVMIGTETQIKKAFQQAGWSEAAAKSSNTILRTIRAMMGDEGYGEAPVSQLYLYGHAEDLAFEKMLDTFTKRHHLRLWHAPLQTDDGRDIWLGAATHDIGIDIHPGVVSHMTEADLDLERAKVGADLAFSGCVASQQLITRPNALTQGTTATGGAWKTDGRLLAIEFKP
jgi:hypothetical protein